MSFKNKITLVVSMIVVIGLSLFGSFSYIDTKESSINQVQISLTSKAKSLTEFIDLWLSNKKNMVKIAAGELSNSQNIPKDELMNILIRYSKNIGSATAYIGFEDGRMISSTGKNYPSTYNPRVRPWYKQAILEGRVGVSKAYVGSTSKKMRVSIMAPLKKDGKLIGVFSIGIVLEDLDEVMKNAKFNGGYAIIYDNDNRIIAHPNVKLLGKKSLIAKKFNNLNDGLIHYVLKGTEKLISFYRTKETNWIVAISYNKKVAYSFLDKQAINLLILGLIILAFSLLIVIFGTKYMMKPLNELNILVKNMASNDADLGQRLEVKSKDEFGEVSSDINLFIEKLHNIVKTSKDISIENSAISEELSTTATEVSNNIEKESKIVSLTRENGIQLSEYLDSSVKKAKNSQIELEKTYESINDVKNQVEELESTMQETSVKEQNLAEKIKSC